MMRGMLLLLTALVPTPLQAQSFNDYRAVYRILPPQGEKPIGEYRIEQRWDAQHNHYMQRASITFSWQILLSTHHYRYWDEVRYGADNSLSYRLHEDNDGQIRTVKGELPAQGAALTLTIDENQKQRQKIIEQVNFDNTLFALRFPVHCGPQLTGNQHRSRTLAPISGEIDINVSRYLGMTDLHLPGLAEPFNDLCLIETTSSNKQSNRRSWLDRNGYLVYEMSASYRLLLVPEASHLPSNLQEKP